MPPLASYRTVEPDPPQEPAGYLQRDYAYSLEEFGRPRGLRRAGGWILERPIPGTAYSDAVGCYPVFACRDWSRLPDDIEETGADLVSLALVVDPLSGPPPAVLEKYFCRVAPFKTHYVADLSLPPETFVGKVHRQCARQALDNMDVEICVEPGRYLARSSDPLLRCVAKHHFQ